MLRATARLVFVQNNGFIRISAGSVQPHIAVALGLLSWLMKLVQHGFVCMETISFEHFHMQLLIYRSQVFLHGIKIQLDMV